MAEALPDMADLPNMDWTDLIYMEPFDSLGRSSAQFSTVADSRVASAPGHSTLRPSQALVSQVNLSCAREWENGRV